MGLSQISSFFSPIIFRYQLKIYAKYLSSLLKRKRSSPSSICMSVCCDLLFWSHVRSVEHWFQFINGTWKGTCSSKMHGKNCVFVNFSHKTPGTQPLALSKNNLRMYYNRRHMNVSGLLIIFSLKIYPIPRLCFFPFAHSMFYTLLRCLCYRSHGVTFHEYAPIRCM